MTFFFGCCVDGRIVMANCLQRMIIFARYVDNSFLFPNQNKLGGPLPEDSFWACEERKIHRVVADAATYGLGIMLDRATVSRFPLINILVSNAATPPVLMEVLDCSKYLANHGTKNC